jgi:hypothetical protein
MPPRDMAFLAVLKILNQAVRLAIGCGVDVKHDPLEAGSYQYAITDFVNVRIFHKRPHCGSVLWKILRVWQEDVYI